MRAMFEDVKKEYIMKHRLYVCVCVCYEPPYEWRDQGAVESGGGRGRAAARDTRLASIMLD